ncbi:TonB family protein [Phenylobacterium deserti]|uniref:TonB C-terminal domain-containing protein n=1 Tax=Phenylobacterium deserti TaxID=1914756 RepID=A0A328AEB4_9CAUL|nr:TonB family protein [Phenylobacterium deserti]RAK52971.1 hypothetical protein DJ018_12410 [Phenylobacterium deserti]
MRLWLASLILATFATGAAAAPALPEPEWVRKPTPAELKAVLPAEALAQRQGGLIELGCKATPNGELSECEARAVGGADARLAPVAVSLAPHIRKAPQKLAKGYAEASGVMLRFTFAADGQPDVAFAKVVENDWIKRPTANDIAVVWPKEAWAEGLGGYAVVACKVTTFGRMTNCQADSEEPAGKGFGQAAILLTPQMLMKPRLVDGVPVEGEVRIPIRFKWAGGATGGSGGRSMAQAVMVWTRAPTVDEVAAAYPAKAKAAGVGGAATLECTLNRKGELHSCSTIKDTPGYDFAAAARSLSRLFQAPTVDTEGKSVNGVVVHLPFSFTPAMLSAEKPVVGKPEWMGLPSAEATKAAFGDLGGKAGVTRVTLECTVQQRGFLDGCVTLREEPAGVGVGQRALGVASEFRMSTWTSEGLPTVGGKIRIPLRYEPGPAVTPAAPAK